MAELVLQWIGEKYIEIEAREFVFAYTFAGGSGCLTVKEEWFPCTKQQMRRLVPLIGIEKKKEVLEYLEYAKGVYAHYFEKFAKEYRALTSVQSDLRPIVESGKFACGIALTKEELKEHKQKLQECNSKIREVRDALKILKKKIEKCKENLKAFAKTKGQKNEKR